MSTSFVSIAGRGFWMNDGVLELWLRLLSLHIKDPPEGGGVAGKIRDCWLLNSRGYFIGCTSTGLDEAVATEEGKNLVLSAVKSLMSALGKSPKIDGDTLSLMGFVATRWDGGHFDSDRLIEVGSAFIDLIEARIATTAGTADKTRKPGSLAAG